MTNLPAGHELDTLVAERVMGWTRIRQRDNGSWQMTAPTGQESAYVPTFSTDIAAAWQVVEHFVAKGWGMTILSPSHWAEVGWTAWIDGEFTHEKAEADTSPLAICRAALAAVKDHHV